MAAIAARRAALVAARNLLLNAAAHHATAGHCLAVRDAADDRAASLVGLHLAAHHAAGDLPLDRDALAAADLALNLLGHVLVGADLAGVRLAFAHGAIASDRAFYPGGARNPAADHLHRYAARVAAAIAAGVAARAAAVFAAEAEAVAAAIAITAARNALALPVAVIDAATNDLGIRLAPIASPHHRSFFNARNAPAHLLGDGLHFLDHLVFAAGVGALFGNANAAIRGVVLLPALAAVHGACTLILFGNPFTTTHGTVLGRTCGRRGTRCRLRSVIISPCGQGRRSQDTASQQGNANMLPHHSSLSFVAYLPILAWHRDIPLGRTGQPTRLNVIATMPNVGVLEKKK
jgi:hypothetical protein